MRDYCNLSSKSTIHVVRCILRSLLNNAVSPTSYFRSKINSTILKSHFRKKLLYYIIAVKWYEKIK